MPARRELFRVAALVLLTGLVPSAPGGGLTVDAVEEIRERVVVDGDCHWGNVWHFMFQCVYPMMELRLNHPDAELVMDLSVQDEGFRPYIKRLGDPRPENIHTPVFNVYAQMLEGAVGKVSYVWGDDAGAQGRLRLDRALLRPRNKTVWRAVREWTLHRLQLHGRFGTAPGCVYVTRYHAKTRVLHEENVLEGVLTEACWPRPLTVVVMEQHPYAEQVARMMSTSKVFLERGAAMAFTVFLPAGARLYYIDGDDEDSTWMVTTTELTRITRIAALVEYEDFAEKLHVDVEAVKGALQRTLDRRGRAEL